MQIIDAQVHMEITGVDAGIAGMDALGIAGVLLDSFNGLYSKGQPLPGEELPNGIWRPSSQPARAMCVQHPQRLAYKLRDEENLRVYTAPAIVRRVVSTLDMSNY